MCTNEGARQCSRFGPDQQVDRDARQQHTPDIQRPEHERASRQEERRRRNVDVVRGQLQEDSGQRQPRRTRRHGVVRLLPGRAGPVK